ncbi:MAG: DEAD/DEAH box helicase [Opitutales bacterium]|nr:DEAD/DEAH box helicase [Opitutales bacterium]
MSTKFSDFNFDVHIARAVYELGFTTPTQIQAEAIPPTLERKDVIGIAQTGTGKTAAFALPTLQKFLTDHYDEDYTGPRVLVLSPTRELAYQVEEKFREFSKYLELSVCLLLGGVPYNKQLRQLKEGADIIVATPGRLLDHLKQKNLHLKSVTTFILDEADRMLDMGFLPDIRELLRFLGEGQRQTLMFSATFPGPIEHLASRLMKDPVKINVTPKVATPEKIVQGAFYVEKMRKPRLLRALLEEEGMNSVMVFCGMKVEADFIYEVLEQHGVKAGVIHSDRDQKQRLRALSSFKDGSTPVLIATDIAARGLDIKDVTHVINYDLPNNYEDYVHRVGRTARAEADGEAVSFITPSDYLTFLTIEKKLGRSIKRRGKEGVTVESGGPTEAAPVASPDSSKTAGPPRREGYFSRLTKT